MLVQKIIFAQQPKCANGKLLRLVGTCKSFAKKFFALRFCKIYDFLANISLDFWLTRKLQGENLK